MKPNTFVDYLISPKLSVAVWIFSVTPSGKFAWVGNKHHPDESFKVGIDKLREL